MGLTFHLDSPHRVVIAFSIIVIDFMLISSLLIARLLFCIASSRIPHSLCLCLSFDNEFLVKKDEFKHIWETMQLKVLQLLMLYLLHSAYK